MGSLRGTVEVQRVRRRPRRPVWLGSMGAEKMLRNFIGHLELLIVDRGLCGLYCYGSWV